MNLLEVIQHLLGRHTPPSASTARQRLQLVLAHDRSDLNPELLEQMRREILEVVQRYVEIDLDGFDVSLETEERVTALVANVPIKRTLLANPSPDGLVRQPPRSDNNDASAAAPDSEDTPSPAPVPAWLRAREEAAAGGSDQAPEAALVGARSGAQEGTTNPEGEVDGGGTPPAAHHDGES